MVSVMVSALQNELEAKTKQLEAKDRQIEELTETIRIQAESINFMNKNVLAATIIDGQPKLEVEKKRGLFGWIRR